MKLLITTRSDEAYENKMKKNFPNIAHNDHSVSDEQMEWIQNHSKFKSLENGTFVCEILTIPEELGVIPSALYGQLLVIPQ